MVKVKPNGVTVVDHGKSYYFPMSKISSVYVRNDSSRFFTNWWQRSWHP